MNSRSLELADGVTAIHQYFVQAQVLHSFLFVVLAVGALYGPYYVRLGKGSQYGGSNVGLSIAFACAVQLVLSGLFHVMLGLEDPFARRGGRGQIDSVHVPELVETARRSLLRAEREAAQSWRQSPTKESW